MGGHDAELILVAGALLGIPLLIALPFLLYGFLGRP